MRRIAWTASLLVYLGLSSTSEAYKVHRNYSSAELVRSPFEIYEDRPDGCPPCFNCNLDDFVCHQFAPCSKANGRCNCPPGFGGDDCSEPLCGSLADGNARSPRTDRYCSCKDGWEGINCNVCKTDDACQAMMPEGVEGVCYREGLVVNENYQMCDITNKKIVEQLKDQKPQATFSCNTETEKCNFQCKFETCIFLSIVQS